MESVAADLAQRLAERAEAVCHYYLPNGVRRGYWIVGDVADNPVSATSPAPKVEAFMFVFELQPIQLQENLWTPRQVNMAIFSISSVSIGVLPLSATPSTKPAPF